MINWRCPRCQTYYSLNEGTFLEQFKLSLFEMLNIIKCWSLELSISKTIDYLKMDNTTVCRQTIAKIFKAIRMVCSIALNKIESITIDCQTVTELKVKFNELIVKNFVRNSNNKCIKIIDLNKYGRRVLHTETENVKLYHEVNSIFQ